MSSLPGGAADKLGNRYEHWWTAFRIADLLQGDASRLRLEPPGPAGRGVEFEIVEDGEVSVEQAKDAPSGGSWTITRLTREGVLQDIHDQVSGGKAFRLIVSTAASDLEALSDRARKSVSPDEFLDDVLTLPQRADAEKIAHLWQVGVDQAWSYLKMVRVSHLPFEALREITTTTYRRLVTGDAEAAVHVLRGFCDEHLHEELTGPHFWQHLESSGFRRRLLAGDENVLNALHRTVLRHQRRVDAATPESGTIARPYASTVIERLREGDDQILVIDGSAGYGKSVVASQVAGELESDGWYVAVARMDGVDERVTSAARLGEAMGLSESPGVLLAGVAEGSEALIVIDQLDAVSTYSGRMTEAFESVADVLDEMRVTPNVKALLVVRTFDLDADPRLQEVVRGEHVSRFTVDRLSVNQVTAALEAADVPAPTSASTRELLRIPLHLAIFLRLSEEARQQPYRTLQELYDEYTGELRRRIERRVGHLDWPGITRRIVDYMSDNETLIAPLSVLDSASQLEVGALQSDRVLTCDDGQVAFFHESYFDFLFARSFVAAGKDLHAFLIDSGQYLFRRAQTRQVLEHLSATDRDRFRSTVRELLTSGDIRPHLKDVVVGVLTQLDATADDWAAIETLAWNEGSVAEKVRSLLRRPSWFDAADDCDRWASWLSQEEFVDHAFHELILAARERPTRAEALVRPYIGTSSEWTSRIRALVQWSLSPELVDLATELLERGELDDARGPIASNSDFWSLIYSVEQDDSGAAARLIGAYLQRGLHRAQSEGSPDPFESEHLAAHSPSASSVITDVAEAAPGEFVENVLPFVTAVISGSVRDREDLLPAGSTWGARHVGEPHGVDDAVFTALENALCALAAAGNPTYEAVLEHLEHAESDELRFLACRMHRAAGHPDKAIAWLISDNRNMRLGWSGSPRWASRQIIERHSADCSDALFTELEQALLDYEEPWELHKEARRSRGYPQYELLSGMHRPRLSKLGRRRLGELERKFSDRPPETPQPVIAQFVGSPIRADRAKHMSDEDWLRAFRKHSSEKTDWSGPVPVGGSRELARVLQKRAENEPARFASLALRFDQETPAAAYIAVIRATAGGIEAGLFSRVCEHAYRMHGPEVGRAVCSAIQEVDRFDETLVGLVEAYANDPDPEHEAARAESKSDDSPFGGDLLTAGLNSTRGQAALAIASMLFKSDEYAERLVPVVQQLATDPVLAVRVCAAEAVVGLLNHAPDRAMDITEQLFAADLDVHDSRTSQRLLIYAIIRDPERFATPLRVALKGPESIAQRAGAAWAVAAIREVLTEALPGSLSELNASARVGAAEVFAANAAEATASLLELFDDEDSEVRAKAVKVIRHLEDLRPDVLEEVAGEFVTSAAFDDHFDALIYSLSKMTGELPDSAMAGCERIVSIVGCDLGDVRSRHAVAGSKLIAIVLRLYRQGNPSQRERCLDLIDRLSLLEVHGLNRALEAER